MHIAIDANALCDSKRTGIGNYTELFISNLLAWNGLTRLSFFSALPLDNQLKDQWRNNKRVRFYQGCFPVRYAWQQFVQGFHVRLDRPDLYLAMDGLLPLGLLAPSVCVVHDILWSRYPETVSAHIKLAYQLRLKLSVRQAEKVIVVSQATRKELIAYTGINPDKVHVFYPGIRTSMKRLGRNETRHHLKELKVIKPYLLYVGNLQPHKNIGRMLEAHMLAKKSCPDFPDLVLAGAEKKMGGKVLKKINPFVRFTGYVSQKQLLALYSGAVALVFPSLIEGFGLPVLEAQACGTPVLCSNVYSIPEAAGKGALFFDPFDIEEMADKMKTIVNDRQLLKELVRRGYANTRRFSWEKSMTGIVGLLEQALISGKN